MLCGRLFLFSRYWQVTYQFYSDCHNPYYTCMLHSYKPSHWEFWWSNFYGMHILYASFKDYREQICWYSLQHWSIISISYHRSYLEFYKIEKEGGITVIFDYRRSIKISIDSHIRSELSKYCVLHGQRPSASFDNLIVSSLKIYNCSFW